MSVRFFFSQFFFKCLWGIQTDNIFYRTRLVTLRFEDIDFVLNELLLLIANKWKDKLISTTHCCLALLSLKTLANDEALL